MPQSDLAIGPVARLLAQTTAASDVPDPSAFIDQRWLQPVGAAVQSLLARASAEVGAAGSFEGGGQQVVLLGTDDGTGCFVYLRRAADGTSTPAAATEKTVTLTLSGSAQMEAFRDDEDVEADEPWYVRDFAAEAIYACHPGTIHRLDLDEQAVHLVLSEQPMQALPGARLMDPERYQRAVAELTPSVARVARGEITLEPAAEPGRLG